MASASTPSVQPTIVRIVVKPTGIAFSPDPAVVPVRGTVRWFVTAQAAVPPFSLEVYFLKGSPFPWSTRRIDLATESELKRGGEISSSPTIPGDYKYGIRAVELRTHRPIADDDPYLRVILG